MTEPLKAGVETLLILDRRTHRNANNPSIGNQIDAVFERYDAWPLQITPRLFGDTTLERKQFPHLRLIGGMAVRALGEQE